MSDKPDSMMIVTSMPVYNYVTYDLFEFNPNPTTEQLLAAPGEKLRLAFPGTNSIMVDIVTLNGHAEVSWKNDPEKGLSFAVTKDLGCLILSLGDRFYTAPVYLGKICRIIDRKCDYDRRETKAV